MLIGCVAGGRGLAHLAHFGKNGADFPLFRAADHADSQRFRVVESRRGVVVKTLPLEFSGASWPCSWDRRVVPCSCVATPGPRKASSTATTPSSKAFAPTPRPRQQIVAYLGELNHDQERRWQRTVVFYNRQGQSQQLRLFPDDDHAPLDDDPDVVRIRLGKVGWTNGRRFGDVWLARWLWQLLGLDAIVERHLPAGKHTGRPADMVAIAVVNRLCAPLQRVRPGRALVRRLRPGRPARRARQRRHQGSPVPHARPTARRQGSHRKRSENTLRRPLRRRLRPAALRSDQQLFRGAGRGQRPGSPRLLRATTAATVSRWSSPWSSRARASPWPTTPCPATPATWTPSSPWSRPSSVASAKPRACGSWIAA